MTVSIHAITMDCDQPSRVADFWSQATGRPLDHDPAPSPFFASLGRSNPDGQPAMMFIKVPEGKAVKNRVHLDLRTEDREAEVVRLIELGATVRSEHDEWGVRWTTMTDPEGNEFCVASHG